MKTAVKKTINLLFVLLIPATIFIGCQEDSVEPYAGQPKGIKQLPAGATKSGQPAGIKQLPAGLTKGK